MHKQLFFIALKLCLLPECNQLKQSKSIENINTSIRQLPEQLVRNWNNLEDIVPTTTKNMKHAWHFYKSATSDEFNKQAKEIWNNSKNKYKNITIKTHNKKLETYGYFDPNNENEVSIYLKKHNRPIKTIPKQTPQSTDEDYQTQRENIKNSLQYYQTMTLNKYKNQTKSAWESLKNKGASTAEQPIKKLTYHWNNISYIQKPSKLLITYTNK